MYQFIFIAIFIAAVGGAGVFAVASYNNAITRANTLEGERDALQRENTNLVISSTIQEQEMTSLQEDYEAARKDAQNLAKIFSDHELDKLYDAKPGLILNRVNAGSKRVFEKLAQTINRETSPELQ